MKILLINNFHYHVGGAEQYYFELSDLLIQHGHVVAFFSMKDNKNIKSIWRKYFIDNTQLIHINMIKGLKFFVRTLYSSEARNKIQVLLDDFQPDVAHVHGIYYYISPSILYELKKRNIPVVFTMHDTQLIYPSITFSNRALLPRMPTYKKIYILVFSRHTWNAIIALVFTSFAMVFHQLTGAINKNVSIFITPSHYLYNLMIARGYPPKQLFYLPYFVSIPKQKIVGLSRSDSYVLFTGGLSINKGVAMVLYAAASYPGIPFVIAGDEGRGEGYETQQRIRCFKNITYVGHLSQEKLDYHFRKCAFVLLPSYLNENQPLTILRTFYYRKSIIATRVGGIPELVIHNTNGLLVNRGDYDSFAEMVYALWQSPKQAFVMGRCAKEYVRAFHNPERHYVGLLKIYSALTQ